MFKTRYQIHRERGDRWLMQEKLEPLKTVDTKFVGGRETGKWMHELEEKLPVELLRRKFSRTDVSDDRIKAQGRTLDTRYGVGTKS